MDQSVALNALAPYIALAKSATSPRAAADLISQATSAPNTYVFAELLQQPNIQSLRGNAEFGKFHELLCIFSWGTWESYSANPNFPPLNDAQTLKLRLLSLLTIASSKTTAANPSNLSYTTLSARLGLQSPIDLEHLITQAIYSNLLTATLNPASQTVLITSVSPLRDLAPGSIGTMIAELDAWSLRCTSALAELEQEMVRVRTDAARRAKREEKAEGQVKAAMEAGEGRGGGGALGTRSGGHNSRGKTRREEDGDDDEMDIDGSEGGGKRGGGLGGFMGRLSGRSGAR